jgi:hypothetical protein
VIIQHIVFVFPIILCMSFSCICNEIQALYTTLHVSALTEEASSITISIKPLSRINKRPMFICDMDIAHVERLNQSYCCFCKHGLTMSCPYLPRSVTLPRAFDSMNESVCVSTHGIHLHCNCSGCVVNLCGFICACA